MKKTRFLVLSFTALFLAISLPQAAAQVVLQHIEDFNPGHKMAYVNIKETPEPGKEGADITWDFSGLSLGKDSVYIDILPVPDSLKASFPKANSIEHRSDGTTILVDKQSKTSALWAVLYKKNIYRYSKPYPFVKRPFAYGDKLASQPERSYEFQGKFNGTGTTLTIADGWGRIILPGGITRKALRVRFEQQYTDVGSGSTMKMTMVTYAWFDEEHKGAIFKINRLKIESPYYNNDKVDAEILVMEKE